MRKLGMTLSVAGLALLGACSRGSDARSDDALKNDLALAAQAQPYQAQQFVSPGEQYTNPYVQQYGATAPRLHAPSKASPATDRVIPRSVSYTHLTLPTICSV